MQLNMNHLCVNYIYKSNNVETLKEYVNQQLGQLWKYRKKEVTEDSVPFVVLKYVHYVSGSSLQKVEPINSF